MNEDRSPKVSKHVLALLVMLFVGGACVPSTLQPTPVLQTVEVTREVTREVIVEITREVTRLVPVTVTPTNTPEITNTPLPTLTNTPLPGPAIVRVPVGVQCLFGPSTVYLNKYAINASTQLEAVGRSLDGAWINVQTLDHKKPCWLTVVSVDVESGNPADLPVVDPVLTPYSTKYNSPLTAVNTNRVGNEVTIFWLPVPMAEADYRGYLVEAWVCRGGQQVFFARTHVPDYAKNQSNVMQAILFLDEPGCTAPSHARIYAVEKNGYSRPFEMPWPPASPTPTPTATP